MLSRRLSRTELMTTKLPWWWGATWNEWDWMVFHPIPLNIVLRVGRDLLTRLQSPSWWVTREEEIYKVARAHAEESFNARLRYYQGRQER